MQHDHQHPLVLDEEDGFGTGIVSAGAAASSTPMAPKKIQIRPHESEGLLWAL